MDGKSRSMGQRMAPSRRKAKIVPPSVGSMPLPPPEALPESPGFV